MKRFIVNTTTGDGCTWSYDHHIAVESDSIEELYSNLVDAIKKYYDMLNSHKHDGTVQFVTVCGTSFDMGHFVYFSESRHEYVMDTPSIQTLDEWFNEQTQIKWD